MSQCIKYLDNKDIKSEYSPKQRQTNLLDFQIVRCVFSILGIVFEDVTPKIEQEINNSFIYTDKFEQIDTLEIIITFINMVTLNHLAGVEEARIQKDTL